LGRLVQRQARFLEQQKAILQRSNFKYDVICNALGISAIVDEWSDLQFIPWMGIVIVVVDFDYNFAVYSPGIQLTDDAPDAENLLRWFLIQLEQMRIKPQNLASLSLDNASNISKAAESNIHLKKIANCCICHLVIIAVKRAPTNPLSVLECINISCSK
jgi:hypothetical protein